jgi:hypothetical protein
MADGYSRATGRTGFATVTGGPGFTNALTLSAAGILCLQAGEDVKTEENRVKFFPKAPRRRHFQSGS